ncbi:linear amide C-N hydrolase [Aureivirga sp. CE67]|uniref:linear amide C-N hydrolase n=1 Tax=Aureivirga sp. CE67 TaxID=1788983 RepID=UPI0018CADEC3|nr:linear amide C-N hydrolase [Aureivirga sp. CE67]
MCTTFSIRTKKNTPIVGRTMELGPNLISKLYFRPEGFDFSQKIRDSFFKKLRLMTGGAIEFKKDIENLPNLYSWKAKYGFVAMNAFAEMIAADGMNTQGLTTGMMVLGSSEFQSIPKNEEGQETGENVIFYPNLTNWILSNCADCNDVINKLQVDELRLEKESNLEILETEEEKLRVVNPFEKVISGMKFHFPVHDAKGNSIVLEYLNGKLIVTDLAPIYVLTNDPEIAWQKTNVINNYIGISPLNVQNLEGHSDFAALGNNFKCYTNSQGTGFKGIPGSSTPVDRFVRTAMMINFAEPVKKEKDAVNLGFHIINTVDIPKGISREHEAGTTYLDTLTFDHTQWGTICDTKNKNYYVRMYNSPEVFKVNLNKLDLEKLSDVEMKIPVKQKFVDLIAEIQEMQKEVEMV